MAGILGTLTTVSLIFGGCCNNVFTLEAIVKTEPDSGLLITFFQFLFAALAAYPTQFSTKGPYTIRPPLVPISRWAIIAVMFYSINMLNNYAFAFNISVPVHIILRSFGSVTTMLAGFIRGKRYSWLQVLSVVILTLGVLVSAWADALSKGKELKTTESPDPMIFVSGLSILLVAQILSAYMGVFVQDTYALYGASWLENLFYSHFLSLPLFLPLTPTLQRQFTRLSATPRLNLSEWSILNTTTTFPTKLATVLSQNLLVDEAANTTLTQTFFNMLKAGLEGLPKGLLFLTLNAMTQLVCISGVNLLSAQASAVTVTIVLNVRKLFSFMLSTWLFGHQLSGMMILGAALVFGSGALYGWETSWRLPREKAALERRDKVAGGGQERLVREKMKTG